MKKYALGSFVVFKFIISIIVIFGSIYFITLSIYDLIYMTDMKEIFYITCFLLAIIVAIQIVFRISGCYYGIKDNFLVLKFIAIKKRTKWYDFMCIRRKSCYSYQKDFKEIKFEEIEFVDLLYRSIAGVSMLRKNEISIKLKNGRSIWLVRNVFSKRQLREIIKCIQDRNSKVEISDYLKQYVKMSSL